MRIDNFYNENKMCMKMRIGREGEYFLMKVGLIKECDMFNIFNIFVNKVVRKQRAGIVYGSQ